MDSQRNERTPHKYFRCGSVDHLIEKCQKPSKDNEKERKDVRFNERVNRASQKESEDSENDNDKYI